MTPGCAVLRGEHACATNCRDSESRSWRSSSHDGYGTTTPHNLLRSANSPLLTAVARIMEAPPPLHWVARSAVPPETTTVATRRLRVYWAVGNRTSPSCLDDRVVEHPELFKSRAPAFAVELSHFMPGIAGPSSQRKCVFLPNVYSSERKLTGARYR